MFDPSIGRWLQEDPLGFDAGDANLYRYAGNKGVNSRDPSGLSEIILDTLPDGRSGVYYVPEFLGFNMPSFGTFVGVYDPITGNVNRGDFAMPLAQVRRIGNRWVGGTPNWGQVFRENSTWDEVDRQQAGVAWRREMGHAAQFRTDIFEATDAVENLARDIGIAAALPFVPRVIPSQLSHSFDSHAHQFFGPTFTRTRDLPRWQAMINRVLQSKNWVVWSSRGTPTYATAARMQGQWIVVQVVKEGPRAGEFLTAFRPNDQQLRAILRLMAGD